MVHGKNHVFEALKRLCWVCIGVMVLVMQLKIPVLAEESYPYNYYFYFGKVENKVDYEVYIRMSSEAPVIFYKHEKYGFWVAMHTVDNANYSVKYEFIKPEDAAKNVINSGVSQKYGLSWYDASLSELDPFNMENLITYHFSGDGNDIIRIFNGYEAACDYIDTGDESGLLKEPEPPWIKAKFNPMVYLDCFDAKLGDMDVSGTWNDVIMAKRSVMNLEPTYVRIQYGYSLKGQPAEKHKAGYYRGDVWEFKDKAFSIPLETIAPPEGYYLSCVKAIPYLYRSDGMFVQGKTSIVYFDETTGEVIGVEQKAPEQEFDEENPEFSVWDSVTDFFSDFWGNLGDSLYALVVPDVEELLAYFEELNAWFSDRLGFIWYPFDLAVQMVTALAAGEADSTFKVPAGQVNIMGETMTIWEAQEIDLDPIGIFVYVRYFTSAILVCGVIRLAINKWDSWIGGRSK